jgi:hypothetical protein
MMELLTILPLIADAYIGDYIDEHDDNLCRGTVSERMRAARIGCTNCVAACKLAAVGCQALGQFCANNRLLMHAVYRNSGIDR